MASLKLKFAVQFKVQLYVVRSTQSTKSLNFGNKMVREGKKTITLQQKIIFHYMLFGNEWVRMHSYYHVLIYIYIYKNLYIYTVI